MSIPSETISLAELERMEKIAADTKKRFHYLKHEGTWSWSPEGGSIEEWQNGFSSRLEALKDAVAPYLEDEED